MSVAIITDSNSGISPELAGEMGVTVIPMPFMIDDVEYFENISINHEQFFKFLESGSSLFTSQPSPETVLNAWDEALKDHDEVLYIPMSSGLSGSYQTAVMLSEDYEGKVFVVNNQRICPTLRNSIEDALELIKRGWSAKAIKEKLEDMKFDTTIYIMVGTLDYLKRGGRITQAVLALGSLLKLKPILAIHGEKLDAYSLSRTVSQAKSTIINAVKSDMENLLHDTDPSHYKVAVAYSQNRERALEFAEEVRTLFPDNDISVEALSLSVSCHIGPESLAVAISKKL